MKKSMLIAAAVLCAVDSSRVVLAGAGRGIPGEKLATALAACSVAPAEATSYAYEHPIAEARRQSRFVESARQQSLRSKSRR
jgi:hypothetical protein